MLLVPRKRYDFFDDFFKDPFIDVQESKIMKTDIKENKDNFELVVDLPGYDKKDIKMHIEDGYLVINASTKNNVEDKDKNGKYVRKERYFGECSRSFYVGENIKEEDIKAEFKNGTLNIEIPKKEEIEKESEKKYIDIL